MSSLTFLAQWALRSTILIFGGALLIWLVRIKDPAFRLAAWIALLLGSLLIPVFTITLPVLPIHILRAPAQAQVQPISADFSATGPSAPATAAPEPEKFNWEPAGLMFYGIVTAGMFLRLVVGVVLSWRIRQRSRRTDRDFFASGGIESPATLGIFHPVVVLPEDWCNWDAARLASILAHERSHINRHDPAVQLLSAIHRALLWFSPASWFLHSKIVCAAEELSDDAAVAMSADRAAYAGVLLDFMKRRAVPRHSLGVPMSRYGSTDRRIQRILDSSTLSRGMTWVGVAAMLAIAAPLAWFTATASPAVAASSDAPPTTLPKATATPLPIKPGPGRNGGNRAPQAMNISADRGLLGLGAVEASVVVIRASMPGTLKSVNFQEGAAVHAGDVLAVVGRARHTEELADAERVSNMLEERLAAVKARNEAGTTVSDARRTAEAQFEAAQSRLEALRTEPDTQVKSPVSGIAGLRMIEPGNMVQPSDPIVTIAEVEPISVLFTLPENTVPQIRELFDSGKRPIVEAWNNTSSVRLATGVLSGMDNQIDEKTGTIKLKATFENKDGKLYPHQFVNVKLLTK